MFGTIKDIFKFIINPFISNRAARKYIENISSFVFGNKIYRLLVTKKYSTGLLAIGEQNKYAISPRWVTLDIDGADYNHNLEKSIRFPFTNESQYFVYTSHVVEHLSDQALSHVAEECLRILRTGGILRIEAPDACKIIKEYINNNEKFFKEMLSKDEQNQFGSEIKMHDVFIGLLSCYIDNGIQTPVHAEKKEIDEKLNELNYEEFFRWCISLQSKKQLKSGGHINAIHFDKLRDILMDKGFREVRLSENRQSQNMKLNSMLKGIERGHRADFSLYVEAIK